MQIDTETLIKKAYEEAEGMAEPFKSSFGALVEWLVEKTTGKETSGKEKERRD